MRMRIHFVRYLAFAGLVLAPAPVMAQGQAPISVWGGIGALLGEDDEGPSLSKDTKQLGLQLSLPVLPIALRADALVFGSEYEPTYRSHNLRVAYEDACKIVAREQERARHFESPDLARGSGRVRSVAIPPSPCSPIHESSSARSRARVAAWAGSSARLSSSQGSASRSYSSSAGRRWYRRTVAAAAGSARAASTHESQ